MPKSIKTTKKFDEIEILNLIKLLEGSENKIVCVYGKKDGQKKSKTISALIKYKQNDRDLSSTLTPIKAGTDKNFLLDINSLVNKNAVIENLPSIENKKFKWFRNIFRKRKVEKCTSEFLTIQQWVERREKVEKSSKMLLPVLSTISAFGISLGVPLLSLALFRFQEIVDALSIAFFYSLVAICCTLVVFAIITTVYSLSYTIITNKKTLVISNLIESLSKFILKWFDVDPEIFNRLDKKAKRKALKNKNRFKITTFYNFFYNELVVENDHFLQDMDLMNIIYALKNNVFFITTISNDYNFKFVDRDDLNSNIVAFDISTYKNRHNYQSLVSSILNNITSFTGINAKRLFVSNQLFANNIRFFLDQSESNYDFLNLLNNINKYLSFSGKELASNENVLKYFVDIFSWVIFMSLEKENFLNFSYELSATLECNWKENNLFKNLKIERTLLRNLAEFGSNSIIFNSQYIFQEKNFKEVISAIANYSSKDDDYSFSEVEENILKRGFVKENNFVDNDFDMLYINQYSEKLFVKKMTHEDTENLFNRLSYLKSEGTKKSARFICIEFESKCVFFQNNLDVYEILEDFFSFSF